MIRRLICAFMLVSLLATAPAAATDRKPLVLGASGQQQQIQSGDTLTVPAAKVTGIAGSTQCIQASTVGLLSGTGAACGGASSANPTATASDTAVNGSASTFMRSDAAPAVQKGSSSAFGVVKVDGTTITAAGGVISAAGGGAGCTFANPTGSAGDVAVNGTATTCMRSDAAPAVQKATSSVFGIVKVDGATLVSTGGVISATGSVAAGTPATIKDLWFWYEPTNMQASSGTAVQVLQNLTPWYSGMPATLSTAGGTSGATMDSSTLNSNPVINTAGGIAARYQISAAVGANALLTTSTTFVVFKANSFAGSGAGAFTSGLVNSFEFRVGYSAGTGNLEILKTNIASIGTSTASALSAGVWYQANVTYNSSTGAYAFRVARTAAGSGTNIQSITVPNQSFFWNQQGGSDDLNAKVAAIIVYSRVLTGGEITTVETYLFNKYGV